MSKKPLDGFVLSLHKTKNFGTEVLLEEGQRVTGTFTGLVTAVQDRDVPGSMFRRRYQIVEMDALEVEVKRKAD